MVNKAILIGNLGRDPEVRSTQAGQSVATFSMATSRRWNDRQGNRQEETEWHNIVCWGRQAEVAGQYLRKGKQIYVEGRLQTRSWEDKDGVRRFRTEVVCQRLQLLGRKDDQQEAGGGADRSPQDRDRPGTPVDDADYPPDYDDIPF